MTSIVEFVSEIKFKPANPKESLNYFYHIIPKEYEPFIVEI